MKRRSFLGLLSGALLLPGVAQAQEADAAQVAQRYYAALQAGEVDAAVQLLRPKLVAAMGGAQAAGRLLALTHGLDDDDADGPSFEFAIQTKAQWRGATATIVFFDVAVMSPGVPISYVRPRREELAVVSEDRGQTWRVVPSGCVDEEAIRAAIPDYREVRPQVSP
ncbi:MAG: hypothetical protein ACK54C_14165 [Betaproteobacteria bacterium]|jgi:hypothetical protein